MNNRDMFLAVGTALVATGTFMITVASWPTNPVIWCGLALVLIGGLCGLSYPIVTIVKALRAGT